ncbi:MAG: response regulator [Gammaproteobacteria bacterium]|nr:response regulator [Gammaproteobacteria bacterium]
MAGLLDTVDMRTQLAGHNRMELLLFRLGGRQQFGINVFKVQEVIQCPPLTKIPHSHNVVRGVANMRGKTISVMDLAEAIGMRRVESIEDSFIIITEYNRTTQGFLVSSVDRIINMKWDDIMAPPKATGSASYLTAVTKVEDELVEIIDVEQIMSEISGTMVEVSDDVVDNTNNAIVDASVKRILVADDSVVARNQVKRTLEQIGYETVLAKSGRDALDQLQAMAKEGPVSDQISLVISDIEMPEMDGYTLTTEVRKDPELKHLYIMLHTSLSGVFNNAMVERVGANKFIAKFNADELATGVMEAINEIESRDS